MAYLLDGTEVEVLERVLSGVVIRREFCPGDKEPCWGHPEIVPAVFDEPPTEKRLALIDTLERREFDTRERIAALDKKLKEHADVLQRVAKFSNLGNALDRIEDVINGKVTHYVYRPAYCGVPGIVEAVDGGFPCTDEYGRREKDTKLLTLFGNAKGNLQWMINDYRDGSGGWCNVELMFSKEAAYARVQKMVDGFECEKPHQQKYLYEAAISLGLTVPPLLASLVKGYAVAEAQSSVAKLKKELAEAEAKLKKVSA